MPQSVISSAISNAGSLALTNLPTKDLMIDIATKSGIQTVSTLSTYMSSSVLFMVLYRGYVRYFGSGQPNDFDTAKVGYLAGAAGAAIGFVVPFCWMHKYTVVPTSVLTIATIIGGCKFYSKYKDVEADRKLAKAQWG